MNFRNAFFALALGSSAGAAAALALGPSRGVVLLGRTVDLAFEVQPDSGQSLADACITAEMLSGANPVSHGRVRVTPLPEVPGRASLVRVQSSAIVDEPVLTVTLLAGCNGKTSRTYTFLVDPPASMATGNRPVAIPRVDMPEAVGEAATPAGLGAGTGRRSGSAASATGLGALARASTQAPQNAAPLKSSAALAPPIPSKPARAARKAAPKTQAPEKEVSAPRSRLVMEPLENWLETPAPLQLTTELQLPEVPATTLQREQALAQWKALNMQPEDILQESARTAVLNAEVSRAKTQADSERAAAVAVQQRLEQEKSERYPATIVYGLLALLAGILAWALWIGQRLRSATRQAQGAWAGALAQPVPAAPVPVPEPVAPKPMASTPVAQPPVQVPAVRVRSPISALAPLSVAAPAVDRVQKQPDPAPQPVLLINPEELFDLQQQAEFFVSVGEHMQAIGVLRKYIAHNETTAPAAYLELLRLYRSLSRVDDFNELRAQFHRHFNALVPDFSSFNRPGRPLLTYADVLAEIEAIWSDESVLPLLDSQLFRHGDSVRERFDLAAFGDLLLLNAIARTTPPSARGAPPPRERTTPVVGVVDEPALVHADAAALHRAPDAAAQALDGMDSLLEYDPDWLNMESTRGDLLLSTKTPVGIETIDFDLSDPSMDEPVPLPPITQSDLPAVPPTKAPEPGQPVGFGASSDRFEVRFELEEAKKPK